MKRKVSLFLIFFIILSFIPAYADNNADNINIAAAFSYYNKNAVAGENVNDEGNKTDGYPSSYGSDINSRLFLSVDGENGRKLEWSDAPYFVNDLYFFVPVISAGSKNPWGEKPYIKVAMSAEGYSSLTFSAKLGGSAKSPSDCVLSYSIDDVTYTPIAEYRIENPTVLETAFSDIPLPSDANGANKLFIKIEFKTNRMVNGDTETAIIGSTSGRIAINDIIIKGTGSGYATDATPRPIPTPIPEPKASDISSDKDYYSQASLLSEIGIIDKNAPFYPSRIITEDEFMQILDKVNFITHTKYTDNEITLAYGLTQSLLRLGYEPLLRENINTVYSLSKKTGLLKGIKSKLSNKLTFGETVILIYNVLNATPIKKTTFGSIIENYDEESETRFEKYYDIKKYEGVITECPYFSGSQFKNRIVFKPANGSEMVIDKSSVDVQPLAGHRCTIYVKDDEESNPKLIYAELSSKDVTLTVKKGWYEGFFPYNNEKVEMSYMDNLNTRRKIYVSTDAVFVYNGVVNNEIKAETLSFVPEAAKPTHTGKIVLSDIDDDEIYDYVFISNRLDFYVDTIDYENKRVTNKLRYIDGTSDKASQYHEIPYIDLDEKSDDYMVRITNANGTPASFSDIKKGSVLSIATDAYKTGYDNSIIRDVIISNDIIEGQVTGSRIEDKDSYFEINGDEYRFSKSYFKTYDRGKEDAITSVKAGDYGIFALNYDGKIVYVDKETLKDNYGIFLRATVSTKTISDDKLIQLVLSDGSEKIFTVTDKQYNLWRMSFAYGPSIIRYTLDKSGEKLTKIDIDTDFAAMGEYKYSEKGSRLGNYFLTKDSTIFAFTSDKEEDRLDPDCYERISFDSLTDKNTYNCSLYEIKYNYTPKAAIIDFNQKGMAFRRETVMFVTNIKTIMDTDGFNRTSVTGVTKDGTISAVIDDECNTVPKEGTIIQYRTNAKSKVIKFRELASENAEEFTENTVFDEDYYALRNNITGINENIISVRNSSDETENYIVSDDVNVHSIYKVGKGEYSVSDSSFANITSSDKIFICQHDGYVTEIFVWK